MKEHSTTTRRRSTPAFTLIELLIVVAIIAILAAIAVPNFLEAQTRAKVTRVKADLRSIATALASYRVDHNKYPDQDPRANFVSGAGWLHKVHGITTPIAYISSAKMQDPFFPKHHFQEVTTLEEQASYHYVLYDGWWNLGSGTPQAPQGGHNLGWYPSAYVVNSFGPNREPNHIEFYPFAHYKHSTDGTNWAYGNQFDIYPNAAYNPTNGTKSSGDVGRCGGALNIDPQMGS